MSIGLLNARSVNNKIVSISDVVMDEKLDLLMISETWIDEEVPDIIRLGLTPSGFGVLRAHRTSTREDGRRKKGGGLAVLYNTRLDVSKLVVVSHPVSFELLSYNSGDPFVRFLLIIRRLRLFSRLLFGEV